MRLENGLRIVYMNICKYFEAGIREKEVLSHVKSWNIFLYCSILYFI